MKPRLSRAEANRRLKKELSRSLSVEEQVFLLYNQNFLELVRLYSDLMKPYYRNGKLNTSAYMRDKVFNKEFQTKLQTLRKGIGDFAAVASAETGSFLSDYLYLEYGRTMSGVFKDFNRVVPLELRTKQSILSAIDKNFPADGKKFSERIWGSNSSMRAKLDDIITESVLKGANINETSKQLGQATGRAYSDTRRVVRTETIATYNRASLDGYRALGVEYLKVLENQAGRCDICANKDGKIVPIAEAQIGVTVPPYHPHCRGTIIPIID